MQISVKYIDTADEDDIREILNDLEKNFNDHPQKIFRAISDRLLLIKCNDESIWEKLIYVSECANCQLDDIDEEDNLFMHFEDDE